MHLWERFWTSTKHYFPWLGIIGIATSGLALLVLGASLDWAIYGKGWEKLVTSAGTAILGGGVSAIILKLLAIEGYFLEAVSKASNAPASLLKLNEEALTEHWHEVTARRYFPPTKGTATAAQTGWEIMRKEYQAAIANRLSYVPSFYVKEYSRTLRFSWHDRERKHLLLNDESRAIMVPFDPKRELTWTFTTFAELGNETNIVFDEMLSCELDDGTSVPTDTTGPDENGKKVTTFKPVIADEYPINRKRRLAWDITREPIYTMMSPHIIRSAQVNIYNEADDLVLALQDLGTKNAAFVVKGKKKRLLAKGEMVTLFNDKVIIPEQSFTLLTILQ